MRTLTRTKTARKKIVFAILCRPDGTILLSTPQWVWDGRQKMTMHNIEGRRPKEPSLPEGMCPDSESDEDPWTLPDNGEPPLDAPAPPPPDQPITAPAEDPPAQPPDDQHDPLGPWDEPWGVPISNDAEGIWVEWAQASF
jgi:hypothetical protein